MPALSVLVDEYPDETQREDHGRYELAYPFPDEHRPETCATAIFFDDAHAEKIFAGGRSFREELEGPDHVCDKQAETEEEADPPASPGAGGHANPGDDEDKKQR